MDTNHTKESLLRRIAWPRTVRHIDVPLYWFIFGCLGYVCLLIAVIAIRLGRC